MKQLEAKVIKGFNLAFKVGKVEFSCRNDPIYQEDPGCAHWTIHVESRLGDGDPERFTTDQLYTEDVEEFAASLGVAGRLMQEALKKYRANCADNVDVKSSGGK